MVFFRAGRRLHEAIVHGMRCRKLSSSDKAVWASYESGATMPHETVAVLCEHLAHCDGLLRCLAINVVI